MNAFISYSISENEQYILTLLAQKLGENGITLVTSYNQSGLGDFQAASDIKSAALFIGLITDSGRSARTERVFSEFQLANLHNKPAIFLVERNVTVAPWVNSYPNTIRFDRRYPNQAIEEVRNRISNSQTPQPNANAAAWLLGGLGVLALLSLLSQKDS